MSRVPFTVHPNLEKLQRRLFVPLSERGCRPRFSRVSFMPEIWSLQWNQTRASGELFFYVPFGEQDHCIHLYLDSGKIVWRR